jgi:hypothetical protein
VHPLTKELGASRGFSESSDRPKDGGSEKTPWDLFCDLVARFLSFAGAFAGGFS